MSGQWKYRAGAWVALLALTLGVAPVRVAAQRAGDSTGARRVRPVSRPLSGARVVASAREVRVIFPRDTAHAWGWPARKDPQYVVGYMWGLVAEGIDGPRTVSLRIDRAGGRARTFRSLAALVAAGRVSMCEPEVIAVCGDSGLVALVERGRVVLSIRDSTVISTLFGMRPTWVEVFQYVPAEKRRGSDDSVRVEYIAPQIPEPDSAFRARAARGRRRYAERMNSITRYIDYGRHDWGKGAIWLALGDSAMLSIAEVRCQYDVCIGDTREAGEPGWRVADTSIVKLHLAGWDTPMLSISFLPSKWVAIPLHPGRTSVRVTVAPGPTDTMPSRTPIPRELMRDIVVTLPIARVEVSTGRDSVRVDENIDVDIRVIDLGGHVLDGAPARLRVVTDGEYDRYYDAADVSPLVFATPGRRMFIASFGTYADTAVVTVVKPPGSR